MSDPERGTGSEAGGPPRGPRLGTVIALLVLAGLPFVVTGRLLTRELGGDAPIGDQPGGRVEGRLVDPAGVALAGLPVELWLLDPRGDRELFSRVESGARGDFAFQAPVLEGCYLLRAGGGSHRRFERFLSLVGREAIDDLEVTLEPGCTLTVTLEGADGREPLGGRVFLSGRLSGGPLFGLVPLELRPIERRFEGSTVSLDGLPPMRADVRVELDGGRRIEFAIELSPGETTRTFAQ